MDRDADGPGLIGDRTGDRLANPPRGVGGEFVAAPILEFLHRFHQAHVALLDQIEEGQPAVGVFFRDGNNESEVRLDHLRLGPERLLQPGLQLLKFHVEFLRTHPHPHLLLFELGGVVDRRRMVGLTLRGLLRLRLLQLARPLGDEAECFLGEMHKFLGDLLFEEELRVNLLNRLVGLLEVEIRLRLVVLAAVRHVIPVGAHAVRRRLFELMTQLRQVLHVALAALNFLVEDHAVETLAAFL